MDEYLKDEINNLTLKLNFRSKYNEINYEDIKELKKLIGRVNSKLEREKQESIYVAIIAILMSVLIAAIPKCIDSFVKVTSLILNNYSISSQQVLLSGSLELLCYAGTLFWLLYIVKKPLKKVLNKIEKLVLLNELLKMFIDDNFTENNNE
ncbi:hypothetical protein FH508_0013000 [Lysinibacillus sp. CD3-6]|uniref:hypothetical protein n=1 Tax=Lysinibacillus sp. CD3-6 TaxID=2892541 RepID=UPI00116E4B1C|nr:hypothetical protein [Lysinibacillus sp. CD3-6]UED78383.1 hypothetical protein FH508_0013000 [Lysinibacillus sp. CD3-6]